MTNSNDDHIQKIDLEKTDWKSSRDFFEDLADQLEKLDDKDESYDFTWVGKRKSIIEAGAPINKTLRPDVEASKDWENTQNLFIEGDNLDALKLLQESYLGKVKMIYIDPPYNTGKDFVYKDNFKATVADHDDATDYKDEDGNINFRKNEKTNGRYHSDWLSMMYPRLKLARNLLTDDGVIFISIDDNEQANLKKICDEVFGEENFITTFTVENNPKGRKNAKYVSVSSEFCMVFARNSTGSESGFVESIPKDNLKSDTNGRKYTHGKRVLVGRSTNNPAKIDSDKNYSVYFNQLKNDMLLKEETAGQKDDKLLKGGYVRYVSERQGQILENTYTGDKMIELFNDDALIFKQDSIYEKDFNVYKRIKSIIVSTDGYDVKTETAANELVDMAKYFDFPKNVGLIKSLSKLMKDRDCLVLDFFSGSGTTAHAVMQLNAEDGGNRKHIQVQLPEEVEGKSLAKISGYKTIPEISRERIRRAGEKIKEDFADELTKRDAPLDAGFRALKIEDTNFKDVHSSAGELDQSSLMDTVDNIKEDRSDLDLLFGVLTQTAMPLHQKIEKQSLGGSDVYLYGFSDEEPGLAACFAKDISDDTVKEIAKLQPLTAVFRDASFADSQAKVNLSEHFRMLSSDTKIGVV